MKTQVDKSLVYGFSVMLLFTIVGGFRCHRCANIQRNNICAVPLRSCETNQFCYVQRYSKAGKVHISKGCTSKCTNVANMGQERIITYWCCTYHFCNNYNAWAWTWDE